MNKKHELLQNPQIFINSPNGQIFGLGIESLKGVTKASWGGAGPPEADHSTLHQAQIVEGKNGEKGIAEEVVMVVCVCVCVCWLVLTIFCFHN